MRSFLGKGRDDIGNQILVGNDRACHSLGGRRSDFCFGNEGGEDLDYEMAPSCAYSFVEWAAKGVKSSDTSIVGGTAAASVGNDSGLVHGVDS